MSKGYPETPESPVGETEQSPQRDAADRESAAGNIGKKRVEESTTVNARAT